MKFFLVPAFFALSFLNGLKLVFYGYSLATFFEFSYSLFFFLFFVSYFEIEKRSFREALGDLFLITYMMWSFFDRVDENFLLFVFDVLAYREARS